MSKPIAEVEQFLALKSATAKEDLLPRLGKLVADLEAVKLAITEDMRPMTVNSDWLGAQATSIERRLAEWLAVEEARAVVLSASKPLPRGAR